MLSIRKTYFRIFLFLLVLHPLAFLHVKFVDELAVFMLLVVAVLDILLNKRYAYYKGLYLVVGIMAFYAVYSMVFLDFNTPLAICNDFILQLKAFVPFFIAYYFAPTFTAGEKAVLRRTCEALTVSVLLLTLVSFAVAGGFNYYFLELFILHPVSIGTISLLSFLIYLYCSVREDGTVGKRDVVKMVLILCVGLLSTRAKFYGEFVISLFFLFFYVPGMLKRAKPGHIALVAGMCVLVLVVSWFKIDYYFIQSRAAETVSESELPSFARPALYAGMGMILMDYPLLGTGLASYATHSSTPFVNYSSVYRMYDLDQVWGLSYDMPNFITDAFYAELAQFGLIGIALFVFFIYWICQRSRLELYIGSKYNYAIITVIVMTVLIESTSGSFFIQCPGVIVMLLSGMILGAHKNITRREAKGILNGEYKITKTE